MLLLWPQAAPQTPLVDERAPADRPSLCGRRIVFEGYYASGEPCLQTEIGELCADARAC